ncbi:arylesterase [Novosphingobium rosa]|uniref:arylesterase n=1 Tax=Novosphingobium rosa TaxID=76978 RepID=UPI001FDF28C5|nr:arylesterase [Novosphingobium rosa]
MRQAGMMVAVLAAALALGGCGQKPEDAASGGAASAQSAPQAQGARIVALGDSLLAGYGITPQQAYPARLEAALRAQGVAASVTNAGVSGDTTADGLARLDFTLGGQKPDLVLISLGGNDMLRGLPPETARANLDAILTSLKKKHIPVVLLGMMAAPNMGKAYGKSFDAIYPDLAKKHHAALVPFFMAPIMGKEGMQLPDHIHPTPEGVEAMVKATIGTVKGALPKK